ncbi:hypothetical protein BGX28_006340 [Mortierella sp. GBA30]|nr:hypothetical protein BGX28_006340 [Mortierella sp. GBA30]
MARRQSCGDLPPTSIIIPPYSRSSSPPFVTKASSHSKSASTDMRSSVKSRLLRNWIGQNGQQEYKVLERSLARFHQKDRYRIEVLKTNLLPWLKKDQPNLDSLSEASLKTGRLLIIQWWTTLLAVLPDALYTDRCHYFECIVALMTRKEFDEFDRVEDLMSKPTTPSTARTFVDGSGNGSLTEHTSSTTSVSSSTTLGSGYPFTDSSAFWSSFHQYRKALTQSLQYAIERLNQKGVYSNVITFCAKILALCFFKLPGVAFGLLHALPASRSYISRMAKAMDLGGENSGMPQMVSFFPEHLSSICFVGSGTWWREFEKQKRKMSTGEAVPPMEMFGNWVRRWQSDDSELFFAFYRHYHHCLSQYLEAPLQRIQTGGWTTSAITSKVYASAPGYLYLSAFFLTKIEGLVHREIHPVTTIVQFEPNAANGNGNAERDRAMASVATGEFPGTAAPPAVKLPNGVDANKDNANGGPTTGKPKVLDMASRRFVETIVAIMEDHGNIYGAMLDIWIKAVVTRTSVYDVESVFCLLDFMDMLIAELESRNIFEIMESRIDMVKRQYAGELSEVMSTQVSEKDTESSQSESTPSSPGVESNSVASTTRGSPSGSGVFTSSRQRSHSDVGVMQDEESRERARSFYQLQTHQIYLSHQKLTSSDGGVKEKDRSKKSASRSSLIGRRFRRLSRSDHHGSGTVSDIQPRSSFQEGDSSSYDNLVANLMSGKTPLASKRSSTGSAPMTAGSLFRWMFLGGSQNSSKLSGLGSSGSSGSNSSDVYAAGKNKGQQRLGSSHSLASHSSSSSSTSLTMMSNGQDQQSSADQYRHTGGGGAGGNGRSYSCPQLTSNLSYSLLSRKYPEHLTTYAGRSIPEHTAVLNEYVDWLAQCHAYGIKSRMSYAANGGGSSSQNVPGGVPGIGLGSNNNSNDIHRLGEEFGDFSVFSLSMGGVVDVSAVVGHHDEWISPGMAQMMMLRFPGLVVEWPKFWNNNSRESSSGPPPGPITTLSAMTVVNTPALTLAKGNAGGVGTGISAGAGGPFGGASLNGPSGGPSSLKHQQQAQMHHQQQMQLWSRSAAAAAAAEKAAQQTSVEKVAQVVSQQSSAGTSPAAVSKY